MELMMFIDPDTSSDDVADTPGTQGRDDGDDDDANTPDTHGYANNAFAACENDLEEAAHLADQHTAAEAGEIVPDGRATPAGRRRNDFAPQGPVRRTVWTPPWSLRAPHLEPKELLFAEPKTQRRSP